MKNWEKLTKSERADIVKKFCELHDSRDYTVTEIAKKLEIRRDTAGYLCSLKRWYDSD